MNQEFIMKTTFESTGNQNKEKGLQKLNKNFKEKHTKQAEIFTVQKLGSLFCELQNGNLLILNGFK